VSPHRAKRRWQAALDPGYPPDSPNRREWSDCIVCPGQVGRSTIRYRFATPA